MKIFLTCLFLQFVFFACNPEEPAKGPLPRVDPTVIADLWGDAPCKYWHRAVCPDSWMGTQDGCDCECYDEQGQPKWDDDCGEFTGVENTDDNRDRFEPNDTWEEAKNVLIGAHPGLTLTAGDEDWYSLYLEAGQTVDVTITFEHARGDLDISGLGINMATLAYSESIDDNEAIKMTAEYDGTYRIVVSGHHHASNEYDLHLSWGTVACADDPVEPDDTPGEATLIQDGLDLQARYCPWDTDWYRFHIEKDQVVRATLVQSEDVDGSFDIFDSQLLYGIFPRDGKAEIVWQAPESGEYYLRVNGLKPAFDYRLQFEIGAAEDIPVPDNEVRWEACSEYIDLGSVCGEGLDTSGNETHVELDEIQSSGTRCYRLRVEECDWWSYRCLRFEARLFADMSHAIYQFRLKEENKEFEVANWESDPWLGLLKKFVRLWHDDYFDESKDFVIEVRCRENPQADCDQPWTLKMFGGWPMGWE